MRTVQLKEMWYESSLELSMILYVKLSFYRVIQKAALFSKKCSVNCSTLILQPFLIDTLKH